VVADAPPEQGRRKLQQSRLRLGLISLALFVAGLALMVANVLFPLAAALSFIGVIGLNLVRVGRP
jgi:hypothetical protein